MLKVYAGSVNQELVAALVASGARAVGLTGMDALITEALFNESENWALVGKPDRVYVRIVRAFDA